MRIAVASLMQETNTFSPVWTRYEDFDPIFGSLALERHRGKLTELGGFMSCLAEAGAEALPVGAAWAMTANRLVRADFERLAGEFIARLVEAPEPDALLFSLHGAQAAEGEDDVAGYLLGECRRILGHDRPIVATFDLHANVTRAAVEAADAVVGYHTYPHVDMFEVGDKAARLALGTLEGAISPVMAFRKIPLIVPPENMQTTSGPMASLVRQAEAWEADGAALSVSVFGVQPWMDLPEMGCSVVAVTDGDPQAAQRQADDLARSFWAARREFAVELETPEEAIRKALATEGGPVVLAESADGVGSGSPGDSTGVLGPLLRAGLSEPAAIFLVDPEAVAEAARAGVGASITLKLGGKLDPERSQPVTATVRVRMLSDGRWTPQARGYNPGIETSMGRAAVLEVGAVRILTAERAAMTVDPEIYRSHGIEPRRLKIVAVKSPNAFREAFGPLAKAVFLVDTPGASTPNLTSLPYRRLPHPMYPFDPKLEWSPGGSARPTSG